MSRIFCLIVIGITLFSCNVSNSIKVIRDTVKKASEKFNNPIKFELEEINEQRTLILNLTNKPKDDFEVSRIFDFVYDELENKRESFTNYLVRFAGQELLNVTSEDMFKVKFQQNNFDKIVNSFLNRNYREIYNSTDYKLRSSMSYEDYTKYFDGLIIDNYTTFDGYLIKIYDSEKYILFRTSKGKHYIQIVLKLEEANKTIYGIEIV